MSLLREEIKFFLLKLSSISSFIQSYIKCALFPESNSDGGKESETNSIKSVPTQFRRTLSLHFFLYVVDAFSFMYFS
jgi:hypothetical protein